MKNRLAYLQTGGFYVSANVTDQSSVRTTFCRIPVVTIFMIRHE